MFLKRLLFLIILLAHLAIFWKLDLATYLQGKVQLWDFDVYHQTAVDVRHGAHPYKLEYMQTAGPPLVIAPFIPFSYLPLAVARAVMTLVSLASIFGTSWLLSKKVFPRSPLLFSVTLNLLFLVLFQPRFNLLLGQPNLFIMFLITCILTKKDSASNGLLLSIITIVKTHYIFSWLPFIKKSPKQILFALIALSIFALVTLPILKPIFYSDYITSRLEKHVAEPLIISDVGYYNQSLRATASRLSIGNTFAVITVSFIVIGSIYILKSGDVASGFLLSVLISPIVWQHYMVVTYPIIFITFLEFSKVKKMPWYFLLSAVLLLTHLPWLHEKPLSLTLGLLASHYFIGTLLLFISRYTFSTLPHLRLHK
jgi:hypothetical protein